MEWLLAIAGGYLLGSIPFGLVLTRIVMGRDVRDIGSGNIGATNVLRTGNKGLALVTLLLDAAKAGVAAWVAATVLGYPFNLVAGAAALLGHCYPIWLKFKGGKGVATFFGVLLAVAWPVFLVAAVTWLIVAFVSKYSSLGALVAAVAAPIAAVVMGLKGVAVMAVVLAVIMYIRHAENIGRLRAGTESRIGGR